MYRRAAAHPTSNSPAETPSAARVPLVSAPGPAINAPYSATPSTLPACRVAFNAPDATPDCARSTVPSTDEVIGGTTRPTPAPISSIGNAIIAIDVRGVRPSSATQPSD